MSEKLNIYQKLIEVRKAVPYLKKDNDGYQFKYVSSSQTLGILREKMDENGLLLVPSIIDHKTSDHKTSKGGHEYFTELTMGFTWINAEIPDETISCTWGGQGLDSGEKGIGKALTYAEKYFLLKFFNIPTDKDDPDSFQKKVEDTKPTPPPKKKTAEEWIAHFKTFKIKDAEKLAEWRKLHGKSIIDTIASKGDADRFRTFLDSSEVFGSPQFCAHSATEPTPEKCAACEKQADCADKPKGTA